MFLGEIKRSTGELRVKLNGMLGMREEENQVKRSAGGQSELN